MLTAVNNCVLYSNLKEEQKMLEMFEGVAPGYIAEYFLAVMNVFLATLGIKGFDVDPTVAEVVNGWFDILNNAE